MIKEWLIRTKNNHILGPVTKEKIRQLITNGSIKGDDEICAGNGHWIFIREQELIDKYVFGDTPQGFNPVQESLPVLTQISIHDRRNHPVQEATDGAILPSESDLMYPGEDSSVQSQTNDTSVGFDPKKDLVRNTPIAPPRVPGKKTPDKLSGVRARADQKPPEAPASARSETTKTSEIVSLQPQVKKKTDTRSRKTEAVVKPSMSGKRLMLITMIFIIFGLILLYFRGSVVKKLIESSSIIMPSAYAQTMILDKKKNGLIDHK